MILRPGFFLLAAMLLAAAPVQARDVDLSVPGGSAARAVIALARQTGTSIVIADAGLARRKVPAIKGRMAAAEALARIAAAAGAKVVAIGPSAWRLVPLDAAPPRRQAAAYSAPASRARPAPIAPPTVAEPIIVTATKRDLRLEDVPAQVTLLDGDMLEQGGVGGTEKIAQRLATVTSTHLGSGRNKLFIRGIADSSFVGPTQATVGQYLGDLRMNYAAPDPDLRLSDMARIEVLEGPQGTLYGAGSLGGIIRLVPRTPEFDVAEASGILGGGLTQHGMPSADASLTVNLPVVTERLALRGTADFASLGGYIDKPAIGERDVNRTEIFAGKLALRADITPGWTVDLMGVAQRIDAADSQYADRFGRPLESSAEVVEGADARFGAAQLVLSGSFGRVQLRSTTGIVGQRLEERYDAGDPAIAPRRFVQGNRSHMVSTETRLWQPETNGFAWLFGGSYISSATTLSRRFETDPAGGGPSPIPLRAIATGVRNAIDELTVYGEASVRIRPAILASAGGRFTWSRLSGSGEDVLPAIALAGAPITASRDLVTFLPSLALTAEVGEHSAIYLRYQEGFRPGGLAIESNFVRRYEDDRTRTFEVGARHGRPAIDDFDLALNLSYTRWLDIQADYIDAIGLPSTANIGDGRIWSASFGAGVRITDGLRAEAGATWNESKVDALPLIALTRSQQVPNIAHFSGRAALDWTRHIASLGDLSVSGWLGYVGRSRLGIGPQLGEAQGDYLDSGLHARLGSDAFGISFSVTNLTDARGNRFSLGTPFDDPQERVTPLRPRTIRLGIDRRF